MCAVEGRLCVVALDRAFENLFAIMREKFIRFFVNVVPDADESAKILCADVR
jgi:hypothetical protein